ncbi:hypothetical protein GCM10022243_29330 [Saccharothrix violaceirubra]|uniref:Tachylectin n=1 Tax=Saccharothrix violaceirubra TaxID=413306 RepID=A0A7W7T9P8_9PSEU|nr:N,N-dimethylformamidase beta subunit family domain-containing protein [Saccharothrix violaceirubra]MBB4969142.1 hypothetical protein [Saccharothrix violaceirubra]
MAIDSEQSQLRMVPGGNGVFYSVQADGRLLRFRHSGWQVGTFDWENNGVGVAIGTGWHVYDTVLGAADGQLFGITGDGAVHWHRYDAVAGRWAPNSGAVIKTGLGGYPTVFGGWDGVLYAVDGDGRLFWFRYTAGNGSSGPNAWAGGGEPLPIKDDVRLYLQYLADQQGVVYAVRQGGGLDWFRHLGGGNWANGGVPIRVGSGWTTDDQREISAQGGSLYSVLIDRSSEPGPDHELNWYRLVNWLDPAGGPNWANGGTGRRCGVGWTTCRTANLQGYATSWSVRSGASLGVKVSSTFDSFQASVRRVEGPLPEGGTTVWGPVTTRGRLQLLPPGYRRSGCGWADSVTVPVGTSWPSGLYTVVLSGPSGLTRTIPFVVRPTTPAARLAVLIPTLTHNAYNSWGGHSQYTWDNVPTHRYVTTRRPADNAVLRPPGRVDARWFSDLLLLRWLKRNGYAHDCYQDLDLHHDPALFDRYRAVVLCTHPEYWSAGMRDALGRYLDRGGRVVSLGGNVIYEPVSTTDDAVIVHRDAAGARTPWAALGKPAWELVGTAFTDESYLTFEPYKIVSAHPFLTGTGLSVGSTVGADGYNFAAAGWEMDASPANLPGLQVIARSPQPGGAEIVQYRRTGGGWAFSVGSLSFVGSLDRDTALTALVRNAIDAALA